MKIALVFPPLYGVDMPPLGIAYIAAKLIKDGHEVKVFCFNSRMYKENENKRFLWDWDKSYEWSSPEKINKYFDINSIVEKWTKEILGFNPAIVGFSINSHSRILANFLADKLKNKKNNLYIIFGGPWCTELINTYELNRNVDIYVRGEGEGIVSSIVEGIMSGERSVDLNIKGTIVKTEEGFNDNGINTKISDINKIPFPALHLFNLEDYTNKDDIPIIFSRGCNYYCRFCTDKPMWGSYRMRSADNIINEMRRHSLIFKRKIFKCNDLMVNGNLTQLNKFAEVVIREHFEFKWGSMARARSDMDRDLFKKLSSSGCIYLTYGIESGAHKVLSHMGKPDKTAISKSLMMTHTAGIKVNTLWMVGYPAESWIDFLETMLFLLLNRKYIDEFVGVSSCYIPRQSLLHKQEKLLKIKYNNKSQWYIGITNTPFIRELRKKLFLSFAKFIKLYKEGIK